ncbi:hypothetical protein BJF88_09950 [Cellulosimicrobium sp. CUA-896]|nr:hypothetical protein BJF88_09950 [Cellulosimicrobium sp. CUA-896]
MRLEGETLQAILDEARRAHGPDVRIVSAERVITGGFKGLFGRQHYEAVVEVTGGSTAPLPAAGVRFPAARRAGIAALLDDADDGDRLRPSRADDLEVSTGGEEFAALLDELVAETTILAPPAAAAPAGPSTAPGDLVALVGLGQDAVPVARAMGARLGHLVAYAGLADTGTADADGAPRVEDRRAATEARARGVRAGAATAVALGIGVDAAGARALLEELGPEEVWVVVDASRKPADTAAWVGAVRRLAEVRAMVVVGHELTLTPESVEVLGLPVGWDAR